MESRRPRSLAEKFEFVEKRIRECGETLKPGSRLERERAVFLDEAGRLRFVDETDPKFLDAIEALRDYTLFEFILEAWPFGRRDELANRKLKEALRDAVDPSPPKAPTRGRDTQYELFVAVGVHRGGAPVAWVPPRGDAQTPDIRTRLDGRYVFVEAKRAKSEKAILDAVEDGVEQVQATGCPGVIGVDVSLAFNPDRGLIRRAMTDEEFRTVHLMGMRARIRPSEQKLREEIEKTSVVGILFQDHQMRRHPVEGWRLESGCMTFESSAASDRLRGVWRSFDRTLAFGWGR